MHLGQGYHTMEQLIESTGCMLVQQGPTEIEGTKTNKTTSSYCDVHLLRTMASCDFTIS